MKRGILLVEDEAAFAEAVWEAAGTGRNERAMAGACRADCARPDLRCQGVNAPVLTLTAPWFRLGADEYVPKNFTLCLPV